jgi:hypothetical protein
MVPGTPDKATPNTLMITSIEKGTIDNFSFMG